MINYASAEDHYQNADTVAKNLSAMLSGNTDIGFYSSVNFEPADINQDHRSKIVILWLIDIVPEIDYWQALRDLGKTQNRKFYIITDSVVKFPKISNVVFIHYDELFGIAPLLDDYKYPLVDMIPKKLFNCTLRRVEFSRLTWFYLFYVRGILDKGYVSFLFEQRPPYAMATGVELLDYIHDTHNLSEYYLRGGPDLEKVYLDVRGQVPFCNFPPGSDVNVLAMESKYTLALETYACEDDTDRYIVYEKTFRALQTPTIPLIFAQKEAIEILRSIGFVLPDFLSQMDKLPWFDRQHFLIDVLANDTFTESWQIRKERAAHNRNLIKTFRDQMNHESFYEKILATILTDE